MSFIGTYADLTGYRIGERFYVHKLSGRDHNKAPLWLVRCEACKRYQPFTHAKLANALASGKPDENIFCQNQACPHSRVHTMRSETLSDIRRKEQQQRMDAEQEVARRAAQLKSKAEQEAARRAEKARWLRFANSQITAGVPVEQIMSFNAWQSMSENWRAEILSRIQQAN